MAAAHPATTAGVFLEQASRLATRPAAHYHRGGRWQDISWLELREHALRVACGLVAAGVRTGDRVLLLSENRVEWLACDLGIQMSGAATVPLHPSTEPEAAQAVARSSGAVLAIASGEERAARLHLTDALGRILRLDGEVARWLRTPVGEQAHREVARRLARLGPDDVATIVFAGVAAGTSNAVALTHRACVEMTLRCIERFGIGGSDSALSFLPYADASERLWGVLVPAAAGATMWISRGPRLLQEDVRVARPTTINCPASVLERIRRSVEEPGTGPSGLRGAVLLTAVAAARERRVEGRPDPGPQVRHWLADRLVLASVRHRIGGGRLRFFVTGGPPVPPEVADFYLAVGLPVHQGVGLLAERGLRSAPPSNANPV